jgi:hypothetical protein
MLGYIDRLAKGPDGLGEVHDYKTNRRLPTQADNDVDLTCPHGVEAGHGKSRAETGAGGRADGGLRLTVWSLGSMSTGRRGRGGALPTAFMAEYSSRGRGM